MWQSGEFISLALRHSKCSNTDAVNSVTVAGSKPISSGRVPSELHSELHSVRRVCPDHCTLRSLLPSRLDVALGSAAVALL